MAASMEEVLVTTEASASLWSACVWNLHTGTVVSTYKGGPATSHSLCMLRNQYVMAACSTKSIIHVWGQQKKEQSGMNIVSPGKVNTMSSSPDGQYCVCGIAEKLYLWQVCTGRLLSVLTHHYQDVQCVQFTDDGSHFISAARDNLVLVWSLARVLNHPDGSPSDVEPVHSWSDHSLPVVDLHIGKGGGRSRVITVSHDQTCKLWDLTDGCLLCSFTFDVRLSSVAMDSAEHNIFIGTESGKIHRVNLCQKPPESSVSCSVLGTGNGTSSTFTGHSNAVSCLRVSFDGSLLVSGSVDQTVRTWDIQSCQCLQTLAHKGPVTNILLAIIPRGLTNVASNPTLAIKSFQRTFSKEKAEHNNVAIRIQTRSEDYQGREKRIAGEILELAQQKKDATKTSAQIENELRAEINRLKRINKELYEFKVDRVIKR